MIVSTPAMKINWPISTPTLKNSSASGIDNGGNPTSASAPGEPKSVQQAERERDDPGVALGQPWPTLACMNDLAGHEDDATAR